MMCTTEPHAATSATTTLATVPPSPGATNLDGAVGYGDGQLDAGRGLEALPVDEVSRRERAVDEVEPQDSLEGVGVFGERAHSVEAGEVGERGVARGENGHFSLPVHEGVEQAGLHHQSREGSQLLGLRRDDGCRAAGGLLRTCTCGKMG